jgi:hypothetical protein
MSSLDFKRQKMLKQLFFLVLTWILACLSLGHFGKENSDVLIQNSKYRLQCIFNIHIHFHAYAYSHSKYYSVFDMCPYRILSPSDDVSVLMFCCVTSNTP